MKSSLRKRALQLFSKEPPGETRAQSLKDSFSKDDYFKLIEELHIHEIELETQNEELRRLYDELQDSRIEYLDFYTGSPTGFATLDSNGMIIRCNDAFSQLTDIHNFGVAQRHIFLNLDSASERQLRGSYQSFFNKPEKYQLELCYQHESQQKVYVRMIGSSGIHHKNDVLRVYLTDISSLKETEQKIQYQATHDALTGLSNRYLLEKSLGTTLAHAKKYNLYGGLMFLDLDRFKNINDTLGHASGDQLLIEISRRIRLAVRDGDLVCRLGGDEFVILTYREDRHPEELALSMEHMAERILHEIAQPVLLEDIVYTITTSIGVVLYSNESESVGSLLQQADMAMYSAKLKGANQIGFYDKHMQDIVYQRTRLENDLHHAVRNREFTIKFQPKVNADGKLRGLEALVRWNHPDKGEILPANFLDAAEDTGLIIEIGEQLRSYAIRIFSKWYSQFSLDKDFKLALNISNRELQHGGFIDLLERMLHEEQLQGQHICLEFTENVMTENTTIILDKLQQLHNMGIKLVIGDFVTGFSTLKYFGDMPIDGVKIDQTFVEHIGNSQSNDVIVQTMIDFAERMNIECIAEGVESRFQRDKLQAWGCQQFQGYLYYEPMTENQIEGLLTDLY